MRVILVEGRQLGFYLAQRLLTDGAEVAAISRDRAFCERLAGELGVTALCGDGTDSNLLEEADAGQADEVIALAEADHDNLATCELARVRFFVPRCIALVNDPANEELFRELGIEGAFSPVGILVRLIEQRAAFDEVVSLAPVVGGKVHLTEAVMRRGAPAVGQRLTDLELPHGTLLGYVVRDGEVIVPHGDTTIEEGDRLLVITLADAQASALRALTGRA